MDNIATKVETIFMDSIFKPEEIVDGKPISDKYTPAEGIIRNIRFHPERLESHREEVKAIIAEMPEDFQQDKGGGMTFLNLCIDRNGVQWGEHRSMEQLCMLAFGLKLGKFLMPREMWTMMPGGLPYIVFQDESLISTPIK